MRVLVVASSSLARAEISELLERLGGVEVAGTSSPAEAPGEIARLQPDIALVHVTIDDDAAVGVIEALAGDAQAATTVALLDGAGAEEALLAGAGGVATVADDPATVRAVLEAAASGVVGMSRAEIDRLLRPEPAADADLPAERLTARESEVLQMLALGHTNAEIARLLGISAHTAKFHVGAVLGKLGARSRAEAVARASRLGLIVI